MIILRDFIFLNTNMLNNYLSTIEGYLADEIDFTEFEKGTKGGKLGYAPIIEGNASSETSQETKSKRVITIPAQFQKLYEILEKQNELKHIELLDDELWDTIEKGEILEIQAKIRIPDFIMQVEQLQNFTPLLNLAQKFVPDKVKDSDIAVFDGLSNIQQIAEKKPIPLFFQAISTAKFVFSADLPREFISGNLSDFQGEAVVFGKVQRIIAKGQKIDVYNFMPDIQSLPNLNRHQRLAMKSKSNNKTKNTYTETIVGPAIIITPLAIYR